MNTTPQFAFRNKVFQQLKNQKKGKLTVFYCGNPAVAKILKSKCDEFGFEFRKEVFWKKNPAGSFQYFFSPAVIQGIQKMSIGET